MTNEKRRILVADDDESILEVIKIMLEGESYEVIKINNIMKHKKNVHRTFYFIYMETKKHSFECLYWVRISQSKLG